MQYHNNMQIMYVNNSMPCKCIWLHEKEVIESDLLSQTAKDRPVNLFKDPVLN